MHLTIFLTAIAVNHAQALHPSSRVDAPNTKESVTLRKARIEQMRLLLELELAELEAKVEDSQSPRTKSTVHVEHETLQCPVQSRMAGIDSYQHGVGSTNYLASSPVQALMAGNHTLHMCPVKSWVAGVVSYQRGLAGIVGAPTSKKTTHHASKSSATPARVITIAKKPTSANADVKTVSDQKPSMRPQSARLKRPVVQDSAPSEIKESNIPHSHPAQNTKKATKKNSSRHKSSKVRAAVAKAKAAARDFQLKSQSASTKTSQRSNENIGAGSAKVVATKTATAPTLATIKNRTGEVLRSAALRDSETNVPKSSLTSNQADEPLATFDVHGPVVVPKKHKSAKVNGKSKQKGTTNAFLTGFFGTLGVFLVVLTAVGTLSYSMIYDGNARTKKRRSIGGASLFRESSLSSSSSIGYGMVRMRGRRCSQSLPM